jgi:hypothetical protein
LFGACFRFVHLADEGHLSFCKSTIYKVAQQLLCGGFSGTFRGL